MTPLGVGEDGAVKDTVTAVRFYYDAEGGGTREMHFDAIEDVLDWLNDHLDAVGDAMFAARDAGRRWTAVLAEVEVSRSTPILRPGDW